MSDVLHARDVPDVENSKSVIKNVQETYFDLPEGEENRECV